MIRFQRNDGGRAEAGFSGTTGDCVVRAIAIAAEMPYKEVYNDLKRLMGKGDSPRKGVKKDVYGKYIEDLGGKWVAQMTIGSGCRTHLREDELPKGRLVVRLSKHVAAVIDGELHDTYDSSRGGTRCVYGYWVFDREGSV